MKAARIEVITPIALILMTSISNGQDALRSRQLTISEPRRVQIENDFQEMPMTVDIPYLVDRIPYEITIDNKHTFIAYHNGDNWIKMGNTSLNLNKHVARTKTYHSGVYYVFTRQEPFGIYTYNESLIDNELPILLIHGPLSSNETWEKLVEMIRVNNIKKPIFIFEYPVNQDIVKSAELLSSELEKLHNEYGKFKMNVITHSFGVLVLMRYMGDKYLYHNDIEKLLAIVPPLVGSHLAQEEALLGLIRCIRNSNFLPKEGVKAFTLYEVLGENVSLLDPNNPILDRIFDEWKTVATCRQWGGEADTGIVFEVIRGSKPFFSLDSIAPDSVIQKFPELTSNTGDGFTTTDLNVKKRKISILSMEPLPYNHLGIMNQEDVCRSILEFLDLPSLFSTAFVDAPSVEDLYREADYQIKIHKWRKINTDVAREYNLNMLFSVEDGATIFTNGDMDTFYPWDIQNKQGIKRNVKVTNLSLLQVPKFIKIYKSLGVPLSFTEYEIQNLLPHPVIENGQPKSGEFIFPNDFVVRDILATNAGIKFEKKILLPIRKETLPEQYKVLFPEDMEFIKPSDYRDSLPENYWMIVPEEYLLSREKFADLALKNYRGKVPIYFAITVAKSAIEGYESYLRVEGLVRRVISKEEKKFDLSKVMPGRAGGLDIARTDSLLNRVYGYDSFLDEDTHKDRQTMALLSQYASLYLALGTVYEMEGDRKNALESFEQGVRFAPSNLLPIFYHWLTFIYRKREDNEKAKETLAAFKEWVKKHPDDLQASTMLTLLEQKPMPVSNDTLRKPDIPPKLIESEPPKYPDAAKKDGIEGTVYLRIAIDSTGKVVNVKVAKGVHELLDKAAVEAAYKWRFSPAKQRGIPVGVWIGQPVTFSLPEGERDE